MPRLAFGAYVETVVSPDGRASRSVREAPPSTVE